MIYNELQWHPQIDTYEISFVQYNLVSYRAKMSIYLIIIINNGYILRRNFLQNLENKMYSCCSLLSSNKDWYYYLLIQMLIF